MEVNAKSAYILINCDLGCEEKIKSELKSVDGISEIHGTLGAYDFLVKVSATELDSLREIITWKIRKIPMIKSTTTLMGIEGQEYRKFLAN